MELGERILDWKEEAKVGVNNVWKQMSLKSKGSSGMSITIYTSTVNLVIKQLGSEKKTKKREEKELSIF